MKKYKFAFTENGLYNCSQIRQWHWWNYAVGFPGEVLRADVTFYANSYEEAYNKAKECFSKVNMFPQIMGYKDEY